MGLHTSNSMSVCLLYLRWYVLVLRCRACCAVLCCCCCSGFGSTDANPKSCSVCPQGTFNEGPLPRATEAVGLSSSTSSSSSSSDGHGSSSVAARALVSVGQPDASWGDPQQATGSQSDAEGSCATGHCLQQSQPDSEAGTGVMRPAASAAVAVAAAGAASSGSSVATAAAVSPQQFTNSWGWLRNSGVNPVFYEPTYNPCTPCGPACWTDSPGATSVSQCGEWYAAAKIVSKCATVRAAGKVGSPQIQATGCPVGWLRRQKDVADG
jgi:hypothetical protein